MRLLGLCGSLRRESHNGRLLADLGSQCAPGSNFEVFSRTRDIPVFNEDIEDPPPPCVAVLWQAVADADGLLFATPEYNQALPGSTKNLVDWISRAPGEALLAAKATAVVGATAGLWGARIAQQQLRTVLHTCGARVMPTPSLFVAHGADKVPDDEALKAFMRAFSMWAQSAAKNPE